MFSPKDKKEIKGKRNLNLKREAREKVFFPSIFSHKLLTTVFLNEPNESTLKTK
jgi:hypothetical protein